MSNAVIVDIKDLTKIYKGRSEPAVDKLSLQVFEGEIFGLLGPNGAGKTTIISVLCNLLKPTAGRIRIAGFDLPQHLNEIKTIIGVVSQDIALYDKLTAYENLFYFGRLYSIDKKKLDLKIRNLLNRLGLKKYTDEKIKSFSGGMKRRVNILAGLLHNPKLLFLDEPTAGVDVQTRSVIREFLFELREEGTTMIYTSHQMEDVQKLCSRLAIIDYGKIIASGNPEDLIGQNCDCLSLEDVFLKLTGRNLRD
jgi:ABC-2 type transport system ATP-binding protein